MGERFVGGGGGARRRREGPRERADEAKRARVTRDALANMTRTRRRCENLRMGGKD